MKVPIAMPVDPAALYAALLRWLPASGPAPGPSTGVQATAMFTPMEQRLQRIEGFDIALALRNVGGRIGTLRTILNAFVKRYAQGVFEFDARQPLEADCRRQWQAASHSVRGACAAVGASGLARQLAELEMDCKGEGALPVEAVGRAQAAVARLADELREALEAEYTS